MWPPVTFTTSSSYKPGALYSTSDSWLLNQWCYSQDKANLPDVPSVLLWISLQAGLRWCFSEWSVGRYGCTMSAPFVMIPFSWHLAPTVKSLLLPMFAISSGMSQSFLHLYTSHHACALSCFGIVRLCNFVDRSPPGSSVHGILQARTLEWVAVPSPGDLPYPGIKPASLTSPALAGRFFTMRATWEAPWLCLYFVGPEPLHIYDMIPNTFTGKIFFSLLSKPCYPNV